jgi:hypothetical protein
MDPEDEEQALLSGNDGGSGEEGGLEKLAIPRYYQASWPSLVPRVMHYARPAIDIWGERKCHFSSALTLTLTLTHSHLHPHILPLRA